MKEKYGILGFSSAEQAVDNICSSVERITLLNDPASADLNPAKIRANIQEQVDTLKKSLSEDDRDIPRICDTIQEAIFSLIDSVQSGASTAATGSGIISPDKIS